jgi:hypothetical protein
MKRHLLLLVIVALAGPSLAEDSPMPVLGDHRFVPATRIEDAFLNGYVQTSVAVGSATNTNTPEFVLPDSTVVQIAPASQLFFGLAFRYQHRMKEWLAVNATVSAAGRMGSNTRSLLSDGVTGTVGYALGWKVRAVETSSFLMSGSFSLTNTALSLINVLDWADDIFEGRQSDLVRSRGFLRGRFGLHTAWAINERFGLLGTGFASYGESIDSEAGNDWNGDVRLALSYNLEPDIGVPLGVSATAGYSGVQAFESSSVWFWRMRIAVQTREDFSIGVDLGTSYYESLQRNNNNQFTELSLDTRYYF